MHDVDLGDALLWTARRALERAFGHAPTTPSDCAALDRQGATFVTLTQHGELRGCIGTIDAHRSLREDVAENTVAAAFHDPRFDPLVRAELEVTRIEVSLLSEPVAFPVADEGDLLQRLRPGIDGLVLVLRGRRATFLPQVWDHMPDPRRFVEALKQKAGLAAGFWDPAIRVSRYTATKFREPAPSAMDIES